MEIDWRAHLHPSARPDVGTSAFGTASGKGLTPVETPAAQPPGHLLRRSVSDAEKRAIAPESDRRGVSVSPPLEVHPKRFWN